MSRAIYSVAAGDDGLATIIAIGVTGDFVQRRADGDVFWLDAAGSGHGSAWSGVIP